MKKKSTRKKSPTPKIALSPELNEVVRVVIEHVDERMDGQMSFMYEQFQGQVSAVAEQFLGLNDKVDTISNKVDTLTDRVDTLTERVDTLTDRVDTLTDRVDTLTDRVDTLTDRVDTHTEMLGRIMIDIEEIKSGMREKVDRSEFAKLEKRLVSLETIVFSEAKQKKSASR